MGKGKGKKNKRGNNTVRSDSSVAKIEEPISRVEKVNKIVQIKNEQMEHASSSEDKSVDINYSRSKREKFDGASSEDFSIGKKRLENSLDGPVPSYKEGGVRKGNPSESGRNNGVGSAQDENPPTYSRGRGRFTADSKTNMSHRNLQKQEPKDERTSKNEGESSDPGWKGDFSSHIEGTESKERAMNNERTNRRDNVTIRSDSYYSRERNDDGFTNFDKFYDPSKKIEYKVTKETQGDLFGAPKEYSLAHCVGADMNMGAGIAVEFRYVF